MQKKSIHVAVGVVVNDLTEILIALRPKDTHQGGLWEFPGGKVEEGESIESALSRELMEELGITVTTIRPLMEVHHDYADKAVFLDVWWVDTYTGTAAGAEGQVTKWVRPEQLSGYEFPEANRSIVKAVQKQLS